MWRCKYACTKPVLWAEWCPVWHCAGPRRVRLLQSSGGRCDAAGSALAPGAWSAAHMTAATRTASETTALSPTKQNQIFRLLMAYCNSYRSALLRASSFHHSFIFLQTNFKHCMHSSLLDVRDMLTLVVTTVYLWRTFKLKKAKIGDSRDQRFDVAKLEVCAMRKDCFEESLQHPSGRPSIVSTKKQKKPLHTRRV